MQSPALMSLQDPEWLDVLRAEAARRGRTKKDIAAELGVSRTAVSLLVAGKYSARMDRVSTKIANKVMELYAERVWCPFLHASLAASVCADHAGAALPKSDPDKLRHWVACQRCPQNRHAKDQPDVAACRSISTETETR